MRSYLNDTEIEIDFPHASVPLFLYAYPVFLHRLLTCMELELVLLMVVKFVGLGMLGFAQRYVLADEVTFSNCPNS